MIAADAFNGTQAELRSFVEATGSTFPFLLLANTSSGGNMNVLYGLNDSHIIINKQGIVRYNTMNRYAHFNRYHLDEIRTVIDSLVSNNTGIEDLAPPRALSLSANPNPFRGQAAIELAIPEAVNAVTVTVHDVSGRRVASLWDGPTPAGTLRLEWDGRAFGGQSMRAGIYMVRARIGNLVLSHRLVRVR